MSRRRRLAAVVVVLGVGLGAVAFWWWRDAGRHMVFPKNWGVVEDGTIYRSGQIHRRIVEDVLREHRVDLVIDLAADEPGDPDAAREREVARRHGLRLVELVALDGRGVGDVLDYVTALRELVQARRRDEVVLLHCAGGSERTGGIVASYRMLFQGWDGARAWDEYLSYRKDPPRTDDLQRFVNDNLPRIAERLVRERILPRVPEPLPVFGPPDANEEGGR